MPIETGPKTAVASPATQHQCFCLLACGVRRDNRRGYQGKQVLDGFVMATYYRVNHEREVVADENAAPACADVEFFVHSKEGIYLSTGS